MVSEVACSTSNGQPVVIELNGDDLTINDLMRCGDSNVHLKISDEASKRIQNSRDFVEKIIAEKRVAYGVTTGFGFFANVEIPSDKTQLLQQNLIRSHCCGVGASLEPRRVRLLLALRINVLAKGHSGVTLSTLLKMVAAFNAYFVPWVPQKGSVGCSGDLTPLAHLTLGLMGEGRAWTAASGWVPSSEALRLLGLQPLTMQAKEGIAMINGTQLIVALGAEAVHRSQALARQADVIAALTLEALRGSASPFHEAIHKLRPHKGQRVVAERIRNLLQSEHHYSAIAESHRDCLKVQDAYSLRCIPQVHGIVQDTIDFAYDILSTELNSATDNPLIFSDEEMIMSNGNFHGEYPGKVLDYLAIGIHELAQISERRIERLLNSGLSSLPPFLVEEGGLNSGMMMVQVVAASLVSENKVLCHPSTADSIPTSCGQEDHVSMATFAARKALEVLDNVEKVLAIELMCACQALEFLKPLESTPPLHAVYSSIRKFVKPLTTDRVLSDDIDAIVDFLREEKAWKIVEPFIENIQNRAISRTSGNSDANTESSSPSFELLENVNDMMTC